MRFLIKFGYFGWEYTGFQRGNGSNSVEDTILRVLKKEGISSDIHCAARTDRGVSAISNAMAVDTDRKPSMVTGVLNGKIPNMVFHSYAAVPEDFNPRHCDYKTYRYIMNRETAGPYLRQALKPFRGRHDFRNFCKLDERNPVRTIKSISVKTRGGMTMVDFKARSFLWNQIRFIIAYGVEHSFTETQEDPFSLKEKYTVLMDPQGLILTDMAYEGIEFQDAVSLSKKKQLNALFQEQNIRNEVLNSFNFLER